VWLILQLDDWVLCRIYNKKGVIERYDTVDDDEVADAAAGDVKPAAAAKNPRGRAPMKVEMADYGGYYDDGYDLETPSAGMLCFDRPEAVAPVPALAPAPALSPAAEPDPDRDSTSMPWGHTDNSSSGSEHVLSPSPDLPDRDHAGALRPRRRRRGRRVRGHVRLPAEAVLNPDQGKCSVRRPASACVLQAATDMVDVHPGRVARFR